MHRAAVRDLQQPRVLCVREGSFERQRSPQNVDTPARLVAVLAVGNVLAAVLYCKDPVRVLLSAYCFHTMSHG